MGFHPQVSKVPEQKYVDFFHVYKKKDETNIQKMNEMRKKNYLQLCKGFATLFEKQINM